MPDNSDELTDPEIQFVQQLVESGVRFLVIGNGAAILHGADVVTKDLDLWFGSLADPGIDVAARSAGGMLAWRADPPAISGPDLDHIDLVMYPHGLRSFDEEYEDADEREFFGIMVKTLPLDRVIASKTAADRQKDRSVMPALYAALAGNRRGGG